MNIYIILGWCEDADKKSDTRITNQQLNNRHIIRKIEKISRYRLDAHHWNSEHFQKDFVWIYEQAVENYKQLAQKLGVKLHSPQIQLKFLKRVQSEVHSLIDFDKYKEVSLKSSLRAAQRETRTLHRFELLGKEATKALLCLKNNLGGTYYLTVDELVREGEKTTFYKRVRIPLVKITCLARMISRMAYSS